VESLSTWDESPHPSRMICTVALAQPSTIFTPDASLSQHPNRQPFELGCITARQHKIANKSARAVLRPRQTPCMTRRHSTLEPPNSTRYVRAPHSSARTERAVRLKSQTSWSCLRSFGTCGIRCIPASCLENSRSLTYLGHRIVQGTN
jgi:hypothetical protein